MGITDRLNTGCGRIFVTINSKNNLPFEVFIRLGKGGGCGSSQCEALGRTISLALKYGVPVEELIKHLSGISCHAPTGTVENGDRVLSCADAISQCLKMYIEDNKPEVKNEQSS